MKEEKFRCLLGFVEFMISVVIINQEFNTRLAPNSHMSTLKVGTTYNLSIAQVGDEVAVCEITESENNCVGDMFCFFCP